MGSSVIQPWSACHIAKFSFADFSLYLQRLDFVVAMIGDSNPYPFRRPIVMCMSFPMVFSTCLVQPSFLH